MTFKPGVSGNPSGRPKLTEEEKIVKTMTKEMWAEMSQAMMTLSKEELDKMIQGGIPFEAELFIRMMLALAEKGDWHAYQKYLDRRIGKVKDEIEHSGQVTLENLVAGSMAPPPKKDEEDEDE